MPYKTIISGIYIIKSVKSNNFYIGSSNNIFNRFSNHKRCLRNQIHPNFILQKAYNKYGLDNMTFEILEECPREKLFEKEQHYISSLKPKYNIDKNATRAGAIMSKESREKISKSKVGKPSSRKGKTYIVPYRERTQKQIDNFKKLCHGENHPSKKLKIEDIVYIREAYKNKIYKQQELANKFKTTQDNISRIVNNKAWVTVQ